MTTRRRVLSGSMKSAGLLALHQVAPGWMWSQSAQHPGQPPDEMTRNSAPQQRFPPPAFGPPPKVLPPEAIAVKGKHSLKAHAAKHDVISGAAVIVRLLGSDPALAEL